MGAWSDQYRYCLFAVVLIASIRQFLDLAHDDDVPSLGRRKNTQILAGMAFCTWFHRNAEGTGSQKKIRLAYTEMDNQNNAIVLYSFIPT